MPAEDIAWLECLFPTLQLGWWFRPFGSGHFATVVGPVCLYSLPQEHLILSHLLDFTFLSFLLPQRKVQSIEFVSHWHCVNMSIKSRIMPVLDQLCHFQIILAFCEQGLNEWSFKFFDFEIVILLHFKSQWTEKHELFATDLQFSKFKKCNFGYCWSWTCKNFQACCFVQYNVTAKRRQHIAYLELMNLNEYHKQVECKSFLLNH